VLNVYETFHRTDGHTLKLHADHGRRPAVEPLARQSLQQTSAVDVTASSAIQLELTETIPPIDVDLTATPQNSWS